MFINEYIKIKIPKGRHLNSWKIKLNNSSLIGGEELYVHWTILKTSTYRTESLLLKCDGCYLEHKRRIRDLTTDNHFCSSCRKLGDKNPQYGKPISENAKVALKKWMDINGNPFTWKSTVDKIRIKEPWKKSIEKRKGRKVSEETRKKMSDGIKKAYADGKLKPRNEWSNIEVKEYKGIEYQGTYELKFLKFIESLNMIDLIERGPIIKYFFNGEEHNYFSDFRIKNTNIIFEVKSDYYWKKKIDINMAKKEAAELQYEYHLIINNNFKKIENILRNI